MGNSLGFDKALFIFDKGLLSAFSSSNVYYHPCYNILFEGSAEEYKDGLS